MKKNLLDKVIGYYFVVLVIVLNLMGLLSTYDVFYSDFISNTLICFGILALILYVIYRIKNKITRKWDLIIILMAFLDYLSYYYAFDRKVALKGFLLGREGLFVIYTYYVIFLLSSVLKDKGVKEKIILVFTICGALQVMYGLFQVLGISNIFGISIIGNWKYASGFVFNSNFFGTYMVLLNGFWMSKFFLAEDVNYKYILILLMFMVGILISGAMSAIVALVFIFFILILHILLGRRINTKKLIKKIGMYLVSLVLIYSVITLWTKSDLTKDIGELCNQSVSTISGNIDETFGTGRIYIWKEAMKYFPDYIYTGIGIDNFAYIGHKDGTYIYDSFNRDNVIYKAHNEYLQILVTEGIFKFAIYILFLGTIFFVTLKNFKLIKKKDIVFSLFLAFLGYLVQAFFNISMTLIAPIFYIISGILISFVEFNN